MARWSGVRAWGESILRNFLTSGHDISWRDPENRRLVMVNAMSGVAVFLVLFVAAFDLVVSDMPLDAAIEIAASIPFLGCLVALRINRYLVDAATWVCCITLCLTIVGVTLVDDIHPSDIAWAAVLPVPCYVLLGMKRGTITVAAAAIFLVSGLFYLYSRGENNIDAVTLMNALTSMAAATIGAIIYEVSRSAAEFRLMRYANTDPLTGLANRRHFTNRFDFERSRGGRGEAPLSLLLIDIDHFKKINDSYGHDIGDMALRHMARLLGASLRDGDLVARMGGEEFAVLLPNTPLNVAIGRAEQLRAAVESKACVLETGQIAITISIGVAVMSCAQPEFNAFYAAADRCLYRAKTSGRNRVAA